MKTLQIKKALFVSLLASTFALTACQEQGPAESAGEKIDNAVEDGRDAIDDAANEVEDAAEDAADNLEDATDQ